MDRIRVTEVYRLSLGTTKSYHAALTWDTRILAYGIVGLYSERRSRLWFIQLSTIQITTTTIATADYYFSIV
jgi:hypothetical protein